MFIEIGKYLAEQKLDEFFSIYSKQSPKSKAENKSLYEEGSFSFFENFTNFLQKSHEKNKLLISDKANDEVDIIFDVS
jgi:hypothetical protein